MKQWIVGLAATVAMGSAFAQQALVKAEGEVQVRVQAVTGDVRVGDRAIPTEGSAAVNAGDVITVADGSAARITYANGCSVTVASGQSHTVAQQPPANCPVGKGKADIGNAALYGVGGAAIVGAAVAAGGGGGDDDDRPSSP